MKCAKTYKEVILLTDFKDRFEYLKLSGDVGTDTFGCDRIFNQMFYRSREWKKIRNQIIIRDSKILPLDLAHEDHPISGLVVVHHINPITMDDIARSTDKLFDPDNLICVSELTHKALHYGSYELLPTNYIQRTPGDTCPWKG